MGEASGWVGGREKCWSGVKEDGGDKMLKTSLRLVSLLLMSGRWFAGGWKNWN